MLSARSQQLIADLWLAGFTADQMARRLRSCSDPLPERKITEARIFHESLSLQFRIVQSLGEKNAHLPRSS